MAESKAEKRQLALDMAITIAKEFHQVIAALPADAALEHIRQFSVNTPDHPVSEWYCAAGKQQYGFFRREWAAIQRQASYEEFTRLHSEGAKCFGVDWLVVNMAVTDTAHAYYRDVHDEKTFLSAVAFACCKALCEKHDIKSDASKPPL